MSHDVRVTWRDFVACLIVLGCCVAVWAVMAAVGWSIWVIAR